MSKQKPNKLKKELKDIEEHAKVLEDAAMLDIEMLYKRLFGLRHLRRRKEKLLKRLKGKKTADSNSS
jgi:hypothetical protein